MSERTDRPELPSRAYRIVDYATKLVGLALVVVGLEMGGGSPVGLLLGAVGVGIGVSTVFIARQHNE